MTDLEERLAQDARLLKIRPGFPTVAKDIAEALVALKAKDAEIARLRAVLERVEDASRHYAKEGSKTDASTLRYAHESTRRLVGEALKGVSDA